MPAERVNEFTLKYNLPIAGAFRPRTLAEEPIGEPQGRPPRTARLVALAHKLEELVRSGAVHSYGELARLGYISPARLSQIMILAQLAPVIQEYVLFLSAHEDGMITELELRKIAREPRWDRQRAVFDKHLNKYGRSGQVSALSLQNPLAFGLDRSDECHDR
jgi:hypothetical protein